MLSKLGKPFRFPNGSSSIFSRSSIPHLLDIQDRIIKISPGNRYCLFLTETGSVLGYGYDDEKIMGSVNSKYYYNPIPLQIPDKIVDLQAGNKYSYFLNYQGQVLVLGDLQLFNHYSEDGQTILPDQIPGLTNIISMTIGSSKFLCLDKNGQIWSLDEAKMWRYVQEMTEPRAY